jgi:putative transcriptional regulator
MVVDIKSKTNGFLTGKMIVAMPDMADPRFTRSVIFMCAHDDKGAMGIVLNNCKDTKQAEPILAQLGLESDIKVYEGGPVENHRGFILHSADYKNDLTVPIVEGFSVTGTIDALHAAAKGQGPENLLFALGYAGWTAGQLDSELAHNAWLVVDADAELIFKTPREDLWLRTIQKLGIDPAMLHFSGGTA